MQMHMSLDLTYRDKPKTYSDTKFGVKKVLGRQEILGPKFVITLNKYSKILIRQEGNLESFEGLFDSKLRPRFLNLLRPWV